MSEISNVNRRDVNHECIRMLGKALSMHGDKHPAQVEKGVSLFRRILNDSYKCKNTIQLKNHKDEMYDEITTIKQAIKPVKVKVVKEAKSEATKSPAKTKEADTKIPQVNAGVVNKAKAEVEGQPAIR